MFDQISKILKEPENTKKSAKNKSEKIQKRNQRKYKKESETTHNRTKNKEKLRKYNLR